MYSRISGLGQWFPKRIRRNDEWPADFITRSADRLGDRTLVDVLTMGESRLPADIVRRHLALEGRDPFLGCSERRIADDSETSIEGEAHAAREALENAGVRALDVDAIVSWALVPERIMPSNACSVSAILGAAHAWAVTLDAACASPIAQLETAASLIESGRAKHVLLTQSHLVSRTFSLNHPASPGVGDGATAMLISASEHRGIERCHLRTRGEYSQAVVWRRGNGEESDPPWWQAGACLQMGSRNPIQTRQLIQDTVSFGAETIHLLLKENHLSSSDVDVLATVQPRRWIPEAIAEAAGIDVTRAPQTYTQYAHLGGAGAVANLIAARDAGMLGRGKRAVIYAQGAGFTLGAASLVF